MKKFAGFTLVELLVVIAIIAILAVIGVVTYWDIQKNTRDSRRKADIYQISTAMEVGYNHSNGSYLPLSVSMFTNGIPSDPLSGSSSCQGNPCKYCVKSTLGSCADSDTVVVVGEPTGGLGYLVCANLEMGQPAYFCNQNQR